MTDEMSATEEIPVQAADRPSAGKDRGELIRIAALFVSLVLNLLQLALSHQAQLRAEVTTEATARQAQQALDDARREAEARRISERQAAAEKLLEKLWPEISRGSDRERQLAIASIRAIWPELADQLEAAARKVHPKTTGEKRGQAAAASERNDVRVNTLVDQARALGHFQLYAQADRAYMDAARFVKFGSESDRQLLTKATNDYNAGRFYEAMQAFHILFEEPKQ